MNRVEPHGFRNALGKFATGVTIVTTLDQNENPIGVTASSFNSVSLEPPMVLWSLSKSAKSISAFSEAGHFAVHILAANQEGLSNQFARAGSNKFENVSWRKSELGSPLLDEFAAQFQCKTVHQYEGGDHIIFVGEVVAYGEHEKPPLVFHGGAYAEARPKRKPTSSSDVDYKRGRFTEDFFLYLLSRAHYQASYPTRKKLKADGLTETEYLAMSLISMNGHLAVSDLCNRIAHTGYMADENTVFGLHAKGLVVYAPMTENPIVTLSEQGRTTFITLLSHAKAIEEQIASHFSDGEMADIKHLLQRVIDVTASEIPNLW